MSNLQMTFVSIPKLLEWTRPVRHSWSAIDFKEIVNRPMETTNTAIP